MVQGVGVLVFRLGKIAELSTMETPLEFQSELPGAAEVSDRRKSARYACDGQLYLVPMGANHHNFWAASLRDLSTKGIGLTLNRRFELGATLSIEWRPSDLAKLPSLVGRVVRVIQQTDTTWWHGCELIGEIDTSELAEFLTASQAAADAAAARPSDERAVKEEEAAENKHFRRHRAWTVVAELRQTLGDVERDAIARRKR
jgi:hypothetical protein